MFIFGLVVQLYIVDDDADNETCKTFFFPKRLPPLHMHRISFFLN